MPRGSLTPLSILIGSAIIGAGLYFGLRERAAEPSSAPAEMASAWPAAGGGAPPVTSGPAPLMPAASSHQPIMGQPTMAQPTLAQPPLAVPDAELRQRVAADAQAALTAARARLRETCWTPALAKEPLPATSRYVFDLTFDAAGTEIARGISEVREASRSDVAQCLRSLPMDLHVAPPGANVGVQVTVAFP